MWVHFLKAYFTDFWWTKNISSKNIKLCHWAVTATAKEKFWSFWNTNLLAEFSLRNTNKRPYFAYRHFIGWSVELITGREICVFYRELVIHSIYRFTLFPLNRMRFRTNSKLKVSFYYFSRQNILIFKESCLWRLEVTNVTNCKTNEHFFFFVTEEIKPSSSMRLIWNQLPSTSCFSSVTLLGILATAFCSKCFSHFTSTPLS